MGKNSEFDCGQLCDRAFLIDPEHLNVNGYGRDRTGSDVYLEDTLSVIKVFHVVVIIITEWFSHSC